MGKKLFENIRFTRLVKALMLSYFLTMLMLLGLSFGLYKFDLSEKAVRIGILAVYIISTFVGGFAMGKWERQGNSCGDLCLECYIFCCCLQFQQGSTGACRVECR